jgi:hypothetical protein
MAMLCKLYHIPNLFKTPKPMKKLIPLLLISACIEAFCQSPTTEEEFNYATKGYIESVSKGMDIKQGYIVQQMGDPYVSKKARFSLNLLIRKNSGELAGIIVVAKNIYSNRFVTCIPINNDELAKRYFNDLAEWDIDMIRFYSQHISYLAAGIIASRQKISKK